MADGQGSRMLTRMAVCAQYVDRLGAPRTCVYGVKLTYLQVEGRLSDSQVPKELLICV